MSMEAYERLIAQQEILAKLIEAETEAAKSDVRYSHEEVFGNLRAELSQLPPEDMNE